MATNPRPQYGHVPSQKSAALGRNVFVFSKVQGKPGRVAESELLLIGLNQNVTRATGATLLRWLQLLDCEVSSLELHPVQMEKHECVPFAVWVANGSEGDPLGLDELIPPGDYALTGRMCDADSLLSFAKLKEHAEGDKDRRRSLGDLLQLYEFSAVLKTKVVERDQHVCFMTGIQSKESVDLSWIFPPTWGYLISIEGNVHHSKFDRQRYLVVDNIVSMDKKLIAEFQDNAFGVDVDDGYRIVKFRPLSCEDNLPPYLPTRADGNLNRFDFFLRLHFCWCLQVNLFGGDSYLENRDEIDPAFERLGVNFYGSEHNIQKEDEEWSKPMGKAILETLVMRGDVTREEASTYGPRK